jgi:hypothetical protein
MASSDKIINENASSLQNKGCDEGSFILHILSYNDSLLFRLIVFLLLFYVYFVVTRTDLLVVCLFYYLIGCKNGFYCSYVCVRLYKQYETLFQIHHSIIVVIADPWVFII